MTVRGVVAHAAGPTEDDVERLGRLPRGSKLALVAGPLLVLVLCLTWLNVRVDYGPAGVAQLPQDGWDAWGLLVGVLTLSAVVVVAVRRLSRVELSDGTPWATLTLCLGCLAFLAALVKNLTDGDSTDELPGSRARLRARARDVPRLARGATRARGGSSAPHRPRDQLSRLTSNARSSPGPS